MGLLSDERLEIIAWGGTKETLQKLIDEVVEYRFQRHKTHTRVYTVNEANKWALAAVKVYYINNIKYKIKLYENNNYKIK